MQDWLAARAKATPNQTALIFKGQHLTFAELDILVNRMCQLLLYEGRAMSLPTDLGTLAVLMPNSLNYVVMVHATARMGIRLVPLNVRLSTGELAAQLKHSDAAILIYDADKAPNGNDVFCSTKVTAESMRQAALEYALDDSFPHTEIFPNATQAIVFTSGTTGHPKGVEITFGNHFYSAMASAYRLGLDTNDRWLSVLPLYHVGGLAVIFRSTLYGITTVLHDRFDIAAIQYSFDHHGITMISLVPTMLYRMIEAGVRFPQSLRLILLGGAAASPELLIRAIDMGLPIAPTYGLTESASQVATMRPEDAKRKPGSVGKPLLFSSVRVVDEQGQDQPAGVYGEVVVSGPTLMKGYYKKPEATVKTLKNGELYTGDIGYLDEDGDLWLVQRRSDLIVSGGENVYPVEVEAVLRDHPAVKDVCVVGVEHAEWGQQVVAAVVLEDDESLTEDLLLQYSREHLAGYKQPRQILFLQELPQTASGKVQRGVVRQLFESTT